MSDNNHLLTVCKEEGEFLFIYCDKYNVYTLYRPQQGDKLFLATLDKGLYIERAEVIDVPREFLSSKGLRFYKPIVNDDGIRFIGRYKVDNEDYLFSITEDSFDKEPSVRPPEDRLDVNYNILPVLDNFSVTHGLQKLGKLYFTGIDRTTDEEHPVYGVVDLLSGKLETVYYLYSDLGEIVPSSVSLDSHELTVYVVGKIVEYDSEDLPVRNTPYIEKFFYRG